MGYDIIVSVGWSLKEELKYLVVFGRQRTYACREVQLKKEWDFFSQ